MKIHNILVFAPLGYANAQGIVPNIFNMFAAGAVDNLNAVIGEGLETVDPFILDFGPPAVPLSSISVGSCGTVTTTATMNIDELQGLSTIEIDELKMTSFSFGCVGFEISAGMSNLLASFSGSLDGSGCSQNFTQNFTGDAGFSDVEFRFAFTASSSFGLLSFTLEEVEITSFDLSWGSLSVNAGDLGDFDAALTALNDALETAVTDAVDTLVDEKLIQGVIDSIVPFTIP